MSSVHSGSSTCDDLGARSAAEPPDSRAVFREGNLQLALAEVWPQGLADDHFRVGALPEQEVAHAVLARGPDDQVRVRQLRLVHAAGDGVLVDIFCSKPIADQ